MSTENTPKPENSLAGQQDFPSASVPQGVENSVDVLPVGLRIAGRRVVIVGGGTVALRRVTALLHAGGKITIVSPALIPALHDLASRGLVSWIERPWQPGDLTEAWLAVACTNHPAVNAQVIAEADQVRVWCSRADDASEASAWFPAVGHCGPATVAVWAGRDPARATAWRDAALAAIEPLSRRGITPGRSRTAEGHVVLLGGGPGDPGLMTRRGWERLAQAEVVVVDRLAPLALLADLAADVEIIDVAKVPRGPATPQEQINEILIDRAQAGKFVVRLKGGDPFVFGRGMEEAMACAEAGIPVEVIPGVTSAVAVPELAGIPVTHRGVTQGFCVVSGHLPPDHPESTVNWSAIAQTSMTLVCLMAVHALPAIAIELLRHGLPGNTPVAAVYAGGTPQQRVSTMLLTEVTQRWGEVVAPAVVIIGEVVNLADGVSFTSPRGSQSDKS
ncbi:MAG: uroporphyrinogen-III C-methyltransferase [Actinomycetota bacterium]